jgi:MFS family permease
MFIVSGSPPHGYSNPISAQTANTPNIPASPTAVHLVICTPGLVAARAMVNTSIANRGRKNSAMYNPGAGGIAEVRAIFLVTLFWLQIQAVPATAVGVWVLPLGLSLLVGAVLSGRIIPRIGDRWSLFIGALLLAAGMAAMSLAQIHGGYLQVAVGLALVGLGLGLLVSATVNATVGNAPVELAGPASGVQQTATRFGAALGVAVLGGFMAIATSASFSQQLGHSTLPAAVCVVGALVALIVRPRVVREVDAEAVEAEHPYVTE